MKCRTRREQNSPNPVSFGVCVSRLCGCLGRVGYRASGDFFAALRPVAHRKLHFQAPEGPSFCAAMKYFPRAPPWSTQLSSSARTPPRRSNILREQKPPARPMDERAFRRGGRLYRAGGRVCPAAHHNLRRTSRSKHADRRHTPSSLLLDGAGGTKATAITSRCLR